MRLFKKLSELVRPKPAPKLPYGLTREHIAHISEMVRSDGWEALMLALDSHLEMQGESLLAATDEHRLHFLRGNIQGIRFVAALPTILHEAANDDTAERRAAVLAERSDRRRRSALYGTLSWDARADRVPVGEGRPTGAPG